MKMFILLSLFTSLSAWAQGPCGGKDFCHENPTLKSVFTNEGIYYAKGVGSNCDSAFKDAQKNMDHHFDQLSCDERGVIKCGNNGVPYKWSENYGPTCTKQNGKHVVWAQCDNMRSSFTTKPKANSGCLMTGNGKVGRLFCSSL